MTKLHVILRVALENAKPIERPDGPLQFGLAFSPPVAIIHQIRVGLWSLDQCDSKYATVAELRAPVAAYVDAWGEAGSPQKNTFDPELLGHRSGLSVGACGRAAIGFGRIDAVGRENDNDEILAARWLSAATATLACSYMEHVHFGLAQLVHHVIEVLRRRGQVRDFISSLDEKILEHAFRTELNQRRPNARANIEREVMWVGGKPLHWIVRASDDSWGFLGKLGRRWEWVEASRDEILATVPDRLFESAVRTVAARTAL